VGRASGGKEAYVEGGRPGGGTWPWADRTVQSHVAVSGRIRCSKVGTASDESVIARRSSVQLRH
jgi:hypothetical protein